MLETPIARTKTTPSLAYKFRILTKYASKSRELTENEVIVVVQCKENETENKSVAMKRI